MDGNAVRESRNRRHGLTDRLGAYVADRSGVGPLLAGVRGRAFPDRWSSVLGQVALYTFVAVVVSGVFLVFFYDPSMERVTYEGSYVPLQGVEMSRALESTLDISFDVRAGLLMRQIHHWASLLMLAAIMLHMLRVFFSGAFRSPRSLSWLIVFLILVVSMAASYTGAILPDDMLSGTSLAVLDGVLKSTPLVGTRLSSLLFGGSFPGDVIAVFYPLHILVLPMLLVILFAVKVVLALIHGPAQPASPRRPDDHLIGRPLPGFVGKSGGFFLVVTGIVVLIAGTVTISPVWNYGPANPARASAGSSPEWYLGFMDGALRLMPPGWEFVWFGRTWALGVLIPVMVASLFLLIVAAYPFIEAWIIGDRRTHNIQERPRNNPVRTGIGVAGLIFYGVLWAAAGADTIATRFHLAVEGVLHGLQALLILGPIIGFLVAKRICLGLQQKDREAALHGVETGLIIRLPGGGYTEGRQPVDADQRGRLTSGGDHPPPTPRPDSLGRIALVQRLRVRLSRFFLEDRITTVIPAVLEGSRMEGDHV